MGEKTDKIEMLTGEITKLSFAGLVIVAVTTGLGFFASVHPYLDWFAQFRAIYAGLALIPLTILGVQRKRSVALAAAVFAINGALVAPWVFETTDEPAACESSATALAINARGPASDHDALVEQIEELDPDVLFISELDPDLKDRVDELYPHQVWKPKPDHRVVLYTKYPIVESEYLRAPNGRPTISAVVTTPDGALRVLGAHPTSPGTAYGSENRNAMLRGIADAARTSKEPVLLIGDLNVTMFSPNYTPLEDAGLRNARAGRGVKGTWPEYFPLRIPIDHVLTSSELSVCEIEVGPSFESDHLPLHASFGWNDPTPQILAQR